MPLYLGNYEERDDGFAPAGTAPLARWSSLDFSRPGAATLAQKGRCLIVSDAPPVGAELVAASPNEKPSALIRNRIANRLGITLDDAPSFASLMADVLLLHAREDGTRWRRLRAARDRMYRLHLGDFTWERPVPVAMANFSDDFNRADNIDPGTPWVVEAGNFDIVSNKLRQPGGQNFGTRIRYNTPLDTDDHYAEADITWAVATGGNGGLFVRYTTAAFTGYRAHFRNFENEFQLLKIVAGVGTTLATRARIVGAETINDVRLEANGSSIVARSAVDADLGVTDTAITGNLLTALFGFSPATGGEHVDYDNFNAADLVMAVAPGPPIAAQVI